MRPHGVIVPFCLRQQHHPGRTAVAKIAALMCRDNKAPACDIHVMRAVTIRMRMEPAQRADCVLLRTDLAD
jgi:hypothetical protein